MRALIIGATGATGKNLVNVLLQDADYTEVVAFVRRPSGRTHPKFSEVVTNFENLEDVARSIKGDVWFSCFGTIRSAAGSKEKQWHIDYDIPATFAEIARRNGVAKVVLVSAYGASATSKVFYSRLKGTLDERIASLNFDQCIIFRPGFLIRENSDRLMERVTAFGLKCLDVLGLLKRFRPLPTETLAQKLAKAPKMFKSRKQIIELDEIFSL